MIGTTRRDPNIVRATINESKLDWLGRGTDFDYATYKGTEYAVDRYARDPEDYSRQRGEIFVMRVVHGVIDGSDFEHHQTHRAVPVPSGTYASIQANESKPAPEKPPPTVIDALASDSLLRAKVGWIQQSIKPIEPATSTDRHGNVTVVDPGSMSRGAPIISPSRPAVRGSQAIIDALQAKGVTLELAGPYLVGRSSGGRVSDNVRELILKAEPLLLAFLQGDPLRCALPHDRDAMPEAVTLALGGAPVCADHLEARQ